jgi:hypothetical protein
MYRLNHLSDRLGAYRDPVILAAVFILLVALFLATPWSGDDWETFYGAARRVLHGQTPYGEPITFDYYSNPPWLALIFAPLAWLPEKFGWACVSAGTIFAVLLTVQHWEPGIKPVKVLLAMFSPPTVYIFLHGQIDALVVACALLPVEWWGLVALTKPQVAVGLLAGIPVSRWTRAALMTGAVFAFTVLLFGFWPADWLDQPKLFQEGGHNLWLGLWPFQVPLGVALVAVGFSRRDARLLIAGSPFLSPYAAMSSLLGPWLAALTFLNNWQAALVWASWWGAVAYRAFA